MILGAKDQKSICQFPWCKYSHHGLFHASWRWSWKEMYTTSFSSLHKLAVVFPEGTSGKQPVFTGNAGVRKDESVILGSGRSPWGGHGNPPQYSCLENPTDRGAWQAKVHSVAKSQPLLKWLSTHAPRMQAGNRTPLSLRCCPSLLAHWYPFK